jgi:hypothetical protein
MSHKHLFLFAGVIAAFLLIKSIFIPLTIADALIAIGAAIIYIVKIVIEFLVYKHDCAIVKPIEILQEFKDLQEDIARNKLLREKHLAKLELEKTVNGNVRGRDERNIQF